MLANPWRYAVVLLLLCALLQWWPQGHELFAFKRHAILDGQWWRLITAPLLHTNGWHLLLNGGGLLLALGFRPHQEPPWRPWLELAALSLLSSLLLLWLFPDIEWFVGLSGPLHGLLLLSLWHGRHEAPWLHLIAAAVVIIKVGHEWFVGGSSVSAALIDAPVLIEGHLCGALVAIFWILIVSAAQRLFRR